MPVESSHARRHFAGDMAARDRIRRWQASLRSFYLLEVPLLQFRVFGGADLKSTPFAALENNFRFECARIFRQMAESLENQLATHAHPVAAPASLLQRIDSESAGIATKVSEREQSLVRLTRTIARLVDHLQSEVASEGLYDLPQASASMPSGAEPDNA